MIVNNLPVKPFCSVPLLVQQHTALNRNTNMQFAPVDHINQTSPSTKNILAFRGINFSGTVPVHFELSEELKQALKTEATRRIEGQYPWPEIKNPKGWMVSCETQNFMKTGGLGEVATQLSDAYNRKRGKGAMTIVTPLYVGNDAEGKKHPAILEESPDGLKYRGAEGVEIELQHAGELPVRVFKEGKFETQKAEILTGELNDTKYIFIRNDEYFDITPNASNSPSCKGPYVKNQYGINETKRMAYFSKAAYEYLLKTGADEVSSADRPNFLVTNDWQVSPISALMRYLTPIKHERDKGSHTKNAMTDELYDFICTLPIAHITHNVAYQGDEKNPRRANAIFKTLFEDDAQNIKDFTRGLEGDGPALHHKRLKNTYNSAYSDLHLADRIITVSPNYAEEICKVPEFACSQKKVNRTRKEYNTIFGIVNGYDKNFAEPNAVLVEEVNEAFIGVLGGKKFNEFANMYNETGYAKKMENKAIFAQALGALAQGGELEGVTLYKPHECEMPEDIKNTPILTSVGRFTNQKGYDYLVDTLKKIYTQKSAQMPVLVMLGSGDKEVSESLHKLKDDIAKTNPKAAKRIFLFDGFSRPLSKAICMGGDFMLLPSKWEPCGLTQMEAMAAGNLPVALAAGGLVDTIENDKDGFISDVFYGYKYNKLIRGKKVFGVRNNTDAFAATLKKALDTFYNNPEKIKTMSIKAMEKDFSWAAPNGPLEKYDELFTTGGI